DLSPVCHRRPPLPHPSIRAGALDPTGGHQIHQVQLGSSNQWGQSESDRSLVFFYIQIKFNTCETANYGTELLIIIIIIMILMLLLRLTVQLLQGSRRFGQFVLPIGEKLLDVDQLVGREAWSGKATPVSGG